MRLMPFMCLDGTEIGNGVRTLNYVRKAPLSGAVNISVSHTCTSEVDSGCLACYCAALDETFYNPSVDPAPWFTSAVPASEEFLGFYPSNIRLSPVGTRSITPRSSGGGYLGPLTLPHRIIEVEGIMFATSNRGMSYGERWLNDAVMGGICGGCTGGELSLLPACPPDAATDDEEDETFRTMLEVGVVEPPEYTPLIDNECMMQQATFQLAAGQPYLYAPAENILDAYTISTDTTPSVCGTYYTDEWPGDATTRIEIQNVSGQTITGTDSRGRPKILQVSMYPSFGTISADYPNACMRFRVTHLENEETLVVDSRFRQVLVYDVTKKRYVNGMDHISFEGLFQWGDIGPCTDAVLCVENDTSSDVEVSAWAYKREL